MSIPAYHRQLLEARRVNLALIGRQEKLFLELLQEYADEIERIVRRGFRTTGHRRLLLQLQEVIQQLTRDMAARTGGGIRLTAERVAEIHARATAALAGEVVVGAAFGGVGLQAAQTVLARPELSRAFKSVRRESVQTVDRILQRGILRGATSTQIAREMRLFITADDPRVEGAARILRDRRRIGYEAIQSLGYEPTPENLAHVRAEAGRIAGRAQLIARTEIATSAHEAAVQAAIASPVVAAVRWSLSSRHPERDVCDLLAEADFYGLGAGVYDPRQTPGKPHPRCLCYLRNILREPSEWGKPRGPMPERILDPAVLIEEEGFPPSQLRQLEQAIGVGEQRLPQSPSAREVALRQAAPQRVHQNARALRRWAERQGFERKQGGGPEQWGVYDERGRFEWRVKLKLEPGTRRGLKEGSQTYRASVRLDSEGQYVNPFTGEKGEKKVGAHIPLDQEWFR